MLVTHSARVRRINTCTFCAKHMYLVYYLHDVCINDELVECTHSLLFRSYSYWACFLSRNWRGLSIAVTMLAKCRLWEHCAELTCMWVFPYIIFVSTNTDYSEKSAMRIPDSKESRVLCISTRYYYKANFCVFWCALQACMGT